MATHLVNSAVSGMPAFLAPKRKRISFQPSNEASIDFVLGEPLPKRNKTGVTATEIYCPKLDCQGPITCDALTAKTLNVDDIKVDSFSAAHITTGSLIAETVTSGQLQATDINTITVTTVGDAKVGGNTVMTGNLDVKNIDVQNIEASGNIDTDTLQVDDLLDVKTIIASGDIDAKNVTVSETIDSKTISATEIDLPEGTGPADAPLRFGTDSSLFTDSVGALNITSAINTSSSVHTGPMTVYPTLKVLEDLGNTLTYNGLNTASTALVSSFASGNFSTWGFRSTPTQDLLATIFYVPKACISASAPFLRSAGIWDGDGTLRWSGTISVTGAGTGSYFGGNISPAVYLRAGMEYTFAIQFQSNTGNNDVLLTGVQSVNAIAGTLHPVWHDGPISNVMPTATPSVSTANVTFGPNISLTTLGPKLSVDASGTRIETLASIDNLTVDGYSFVHYIHGDSINLIQQPALTQTMQQQSIPNSSPTIVTQISGADNDNVQGPTIQSGGDWSLVEEGYYIMSVSVSFEPHATGFRSLQMRDNDGYIYGSSSTLSIGATDNTDLSVSCPIWSDGTKVMNVIAYQNSGGALFMGVRHVKAGIIRVV